MKLTQRLAFAFGVAICLLQAGRMMLWGHWPRHWTGWFYMSDAFLVGGLLIAGVVISRRREMAGRLIIAAGWGFACGILFRSVLEQLRDPARQGGHEVVVLVCKGALLVVAVAGLAMTVAYKHDGKD